MFDQGAYNNCASRCFQFLRTKFTGKALLITYQTYQSSVCIDEVIIDCKDFRNPIENKQYSGFVIKTMTKDMGTIAQSLSFSLDAIKYLPANISQFSVTNMGSRVVGSNTTFEISTGEMPVGITQTGCYIKLFYPKEMQFDL